MKSSVMNEEKAIEYIKQNKVRLVTKTEHEKDGQVDIKFRIYDSEKDN